MVLRGISNALVFTSVGTSFLLCYQRILLHRSLLGFRTNETGDQMPTSLAGHKSPHSAGDYYDTNSHVVHYDPSLGDSPWWPQVLVGKKHRNNFVAKGKRWEFIEETFFRENAAWTKKQTKEENINMLGFLRIPKTASTSILTWAAAASNRGPYLDCFFAPIHHRSEFPTIFFEQDNYLGCPHRTYETTVLEWVKDVLPKAIPVTINHETSTTMVERRRRAPRDFSLQLFTIVRDPFDRLVSYFQFVRRIYPVWSYISTPEQNVTILNNNITGWMELLATQPKKAFHLPYQKDAMIEANFSIATRLIQGSSSPRIFTVIQECFEASVMLLSETYPDFFSTSSTAAFLNSSESRQNTKSKFQSLNQEVLCPLRDQAEIWFADDFIFYREAVKQFRDRLERSSLDRSIIQQCFRTLDSRLDSQSNKCLKPQ